MQPFNINDISKLSNMFSVLGDQNRLSIVLFLLNGDQNVGTISDRLCLSQSLVSHQLRVLRDAGITKSKKNGKSVIYSINDEHIYQIIEMGIAHINHKGEEYGENK